MSFDALLALPSVRWKILCEIQGREALTLGTGDWASAGGGAYSRPFDAYTHPVAIRADRGLYRGPITVRENTTALDPAVSLADVQATPGSFWYDEATAILYVQTSGSVHPDTIGLMQAVFTVRVATEPVTFSDQPPYDSQMDGSSVPSIRQDRPDLLRGIASFPSGDLTLVNADGFWDVPAAAWLWTNNDVTIRVGGDDLAYTDYVSVAIMQIVQPPSAGNASATFQLRSRNNVTSRSFPQTIITTAVFPASMPGTYAPMWWGAVFDAPLVPDAAGARRLLAIDPTMQPGSGGNPGFAATAVYATEIATGVRTSLPAAEFSASVSGYIQLSAAWVTIYVDYTWTADMYRTVSALSATPALQTVGAIAVDILALCGVSTDEIDLAAFAQADLDSPATLGLWVGDPSLTSAVVTQGVDLLNVLERSTVSAVYLRSDGVWTCQAWDPTAGALSALPHLTSAELLACDPVADVREHPTANVTVRFMHRVIRDVWSTTTSSSETSEAELDTDETEAVDTALVYRADAEALAARLRLAGSRPTTRLKIQTGPALLRLDVGDKVWIERSRGPSTTGTFDAVMEIESINKRMADMVVEAIVGNQRGLGESVRQIAPDGTANWASATAEERRRYLFFADAATERIDASDARTYREAVVW